MTSNFCNYLLVMQELADKDKVIIEARHFDVLDIYFKLEYHPVQAYKWYLEFRKRWYALKGLKTPKIIL